MSWIEKIKDDLIISTGDGRPYYPSWLNATRLKEFHVSEFDFPELASTLVIRKKRMGWKYQLEIYFQGENHLDVAESFSTSADDERPWIIQHPYYGTLVVQPISLLFDNTQHNVTKITGLVIETIVEDAPKVKQETVDTIKIKKNEIDATFTNALNVPLKPADITSMQDNSRKNKSLTVPIIRLPEQLEEYTNLFNVANSAINNATASPIIAMRTTVALISYPATLQQNLKSRVGLLVNQFATFRNNILGMETVSSKQVYQNSNGSVVSSLALAMASPQAGDFPNGLIALAMMDSLLSTFDLFMQDLDTLQSDNGGSPDSFIPDASAIIALSSLVNLTVANLFSIALNSRRERIIFCEEDTNIILLAHRFYGLDPLDANINELIENNGIGLNQLLLIKKGTRIVYYR